MRAKGWVYLGGVLVASNTQYVSADGMVADAWRDWDEPIIGFNITRELSL